jgi:chorismate dehydratase
MMPAAPTQKTASPSLPSSRSASPQLAVGAVNYLNSKPLIERLDELLEGHATLRLDYPSRLADDLASGKLDVALIPSIEYFRGRDYEVISDACVAAHGPVLSVKLYSRVPWGDVKSIALDEGSRTSATLARILLAERHGVFPKSAPLPLDHRTEDSSADAILLIGDRAISPPDEQFLGTWDLGEEWFEWTGLPFVFAMWVGSKEVRSQKSEARRGPNPSGGLDESKVDRMETGNRQPSAVSRSAVSRSADSRSADSRTAFLDAVAKSLNAARDLGVAHLDDIARREAPLLGLSLPTTISYLSENLQYHLGSAERNGLKLFYKLASGMGLAPAGAELAIR